MPARRAVWRRLALAGWGITLATLAAGPPGRAQGAADWPKQPIKIVIGFPPGGGNDIQWVSTSMTVDPTLWSSGSPNGGEDCAYLDQQRAKLFNDIQCTDSQHFLCSVP